MIPCPTTSRPAAQAAKEERKDEDDFLKLIEDEVKKPD